MKVAITTAFEITTEFETDDYSEAVRLNSEWIAQEYGNLEDYKINQAVGSN
jgi:hypothetical protein